MSRAAEARPRRDAASALHCLAELRSKEAR